MGWTERTESMTAPQARRQSHGVKTGLTPADTGVIGWGPERASMHALKRCVGKDNGMKGADDSFMALDVCQGKRW